MVAQGDGKFGSWGWPQGPSKPKSAGNTKIVLLINYNAQQKELTTTQESICSDLGPKKQPRKDQLQFFKADLGLLELIMDPKLELKTVPL